MARTMIYSKSGKPTPFFWSDRDGSDPHRKTVYRQNEDRVIRLKGIHFDTERKKFSKS